jgi:hypothetical protein
MLKPRERTGYKRTKSCVDTALHLWQFGWSGKVKALVIFDN